MALSLAAAAMAAPLGVVEVVGGALWEVGVASGAAMSHLDRRFFLGGSPSVPAPLHATSRYTCTVREFGCK